jgi:hypothetical protein
MINLTTEDTTWLSMYNNGQQLSLTNNKGYTTTYTVSYKAFSQQQVTVSQENLKNTCCKGGGLISKLLPIQFEYIQMNGEGSFGPILIKREKWLEKVVSLKDSLNGNNIEEKLSIIIKGNLVTFNPNDTSYDSMINYHDTLTLAGTIFEHVFVVMPYVSRGDISFEEFYYSKAKGLIGFKLSNNELWFLN